MLTELIIGTIVGSATQGIAQFVSIPNVQQSVAKYASNVSQMAIQKGVEKVAEEVKKK